MMFSHVPAEVSYTPPRAVIRQTLVTQEPAHQQHVVVAFVRARARVARAVRGSERIHVEISVVVFDGVHRDAEFDALGAAVVLAGLGGGSRGPRHRGTVRDRTVARSNALDDAQGSGLVAVREPHVARLGMRRATPKSLDAPV